MADCAATSDGAYRAVKRVAAPMKFGLAECHVTSINPEFPFLVAV